MLSKITDRDRESLKLMEIETSQKILSRNPNLETMLGDRKSYSQPLNLDDWQSSLLIFN